MDVDLEMLKDPIEEQLKSVNGRIITHGDALPARGIRRADSIKIKA
jgi:hypothetical protein